MSAATIAPHKLVLRCFGVAVSKLALCTALTELAASLALTSLLFTRTYALCT